MTKLTIEIANEIAAIAKDLIEKGNRTRDVYTFIKGELSRMNIEGKQIVNLQKVMAVVNGETYIPATMASLRA